MFKNIGGNSWQQNTPTESDTEVYFYHSMHNSQEAAYVRECLSALQEQCALSYCELSINIQQNKGGQVVSIARTRVHMDLVSASIANVKWPSKDFIPPAINVNGQNLMNIRDATWQPWN